jgi:CRP-like cAMP-binding protein
LTGAARTATVIANRACTLSRLDIADFRELMGRQPDLARAIYDAVHQRLDAVGTEPTREREAAWEFGISARQREVAVCAILSPPRLYRGCPARRVERKRDLPWIRPIRNIT